MKIAILGAGIMGITCAQKLKEQMPDCEIKIYTKEKSPNTTSDVSAGYWEPYCLSNDSDEERTKILKWGKETYDAMIQIAQSESAYEYGVQIISAFVMQDTEKVKAPFWSSIVSQYREIDLNELSSICLNDNIAKSAFHFITTTVNVYKFLREITNELEKKGVILVEKSLTTIQDFINETKGENFDYLINCTGLGSRWFVNDLNVHPVRGQVIRVKAPWVNYCLMLDYETTYILPLDDVVVLGGTQNLDVYDLNVNENDCDEIIERCSKLVPSLKKAEIVKKASGLRPLRSNGIRLELEIIENEDGTKTRVVHNYGHGGSGITLCLGCATNVVEIIKNNQ